MIEIPGIKTYNAKSKDESSPKTMEERGGSDNAGPEIQTYNASNKATTMAKMVERARESGDSDELRVLKSAVESDSELMDEIEARRQSDENEGGNSSSDVDSDNAAEAQAGGDGIEADQELDLSLVKQAHDEFQTKLTTIFQLSARASERGAIMESLFTSDDERSTLIKIIEGFKTKVDNAASHDEIEEAVGAISDWYQRAKPTMTQRMRAKTGYFGGQLPDSLAAQARAFENLGDDVNNMNHYLRLLGQ